jgi:hypothetical protein
MEHTTLRNDCSDRIISFYLSYKGAHNTYFTIIKVLYSRGIRESLIFIGDGIPKLDEEIRKIFP